MVQRVRRLAGTRKVGHAGTLDPQASGLLLIGIAGATRLLTYLVGLDKTYTATIRLGFATTTDDAEGDVVGEPVAVTAAHLVQVPGAISALTGDIDQVPSSVSAIHVDGRRAHELVRAGVHVDLPSRRVHVARFAVTAARDADLDVVVDCSSGTYVRALARDLGAALGVGGHLVALRRTRIGPFEVADAPPLDEPVAPLAPAAVAARLFPSIRLDADQALAITQGKRLSLPGSPDASPVAALAPDGTLIGLMTVEGGSGRVLVNLPIEQVVAQ
jgi:tRNA pseudouridine55 synthase